MASERKKRDELPPPAVVGQRIYRLLEDQGIYQAEAARLLNTSASVLKGWAAGKNYPNLASLEKVGEIVNQSVAEILTGRPMPDAEPPQAFHDWLEHEAPSQQASAAEIALLRSIREQPGAPMTVQVYGEMLKAHRYGAPKEKAEAMGRYNADLQQELGRRRGQRRR